MEHHGPKIGPWILPKPLDESPEADPSEGVSSPAASAAAAADDAKRRRAGGPKARTGCVTCKSRHVKWIDSDERKPACSRCERAGVACQGYVESIDRRKKRECRDAVRRTTLQPIAPRSSYPGPQGASSHLTLLFPFPRSLSTLPKIDHKDGVYFDYFRHQVSTNLAGYYTSPIWSNLVVGEGLQDDSIQHSILAVGALIRSASHSPKPSPPRKSLSKSSSDIQFLTEHREVALRHHLKAVKSLRERIGTMTASSPKTVVITTLLLVVFELVQGEAQTAELLLNSGLGVLKDFITLFESDPNNPHPKSRDCEFDDMEHVLPCIAAMSHLSQSFRPRSRNLHPFKIDPDSEFHDPQQESVSRFFISWGRFFTFAVSFIGNSTGAVAEKLSPDDLRRLTMRQKTFLKHLPKWRAIIQHYAESPDVDNATKKALRIAQIHWLLLHVSLNCCLDPTEVAYDAFENEFRDLTNRCIDLYRDCVSHPRPTSVLLGQGLILPLCTVVRACRNHDIRMTAVQALHEIPLSMVAWDVVSSMDGIMGALLLEETGRDENGFVPPESRWFWLRDMVVPETGRVHKVYQRLAPGQDGEPVLTKVRPTSNLRSKICKAGGCTGEHALGPIGA
ncbi:hypothetical protein CCHL11_00143 [Colletotrichum chlorophyti]|uniref:Zn(2)-C6 fungal-type domain-containing protein n=1 Tax=Colletotrichum chlorophyti TaxID=708187 RepID=A0A1Q8RU16_9PEZI|nr:hypothetical protein CCHL11_00143 [Colletotrichum chlorophyti]